MMRGPTGFVRILSSLKIIRRDTKCTTSVSRASGELLHWVGGYREADLRGNAFQPQDPVNCPRPGNSFLVPLPKPNLCPCHFSLFWNIYPLGLSCLSVLQRRAHCKFMQMPNLPPLYWRVLRWVLLKPSHHFWETSPIFIHSVAHNPPRQVT